MATTSNGSAPPERRAGAKEKFRHRYCELKNSTGESELSTHQGGNSAFISTATWIWELAQRIKQKTFTRCETQRLTEHIGDERDSLLRFEAPTPSGTLKEHPATMENLPDKLLLNIFIRLLAKQLAQMRSVSKSWNALLSESSFVKSHLDNSIHNNNDQILLVFCSKPFEAHISRSPHIELTEFNKFSPVDPESGRISWFRVIGAVNGLICSIYHCSVIHIWNPSLSAMSTLPPYSLPSCYSNYEIYFRFGFDPKTNDYKVVKLTRPKLTSADYVDYRSRYMAREWLQVEVYSMRKGSWEVITERFPSHIPVISDSDYVCADGHSGHLHWIGRCYRGNTSSKIIVAFDLSSETFHEIPLPNSIVEHKSCNIIGVLARKLCVMTWDENEVLEMWVMDEYGLANSWVKHHIFSQFSGNNTIPFGFTTHGEFLIEIIDHGLVLYDPVADKAKFFLNYSPYNDGIDQFVEYVDSLVWVVPGEHEVVDSARQS